MKKIYSLLLFAFVVLSGVAARAQSTLVYSEAFTSGATPTTQCTAWAAYRASLVSANAYTGFKISGSLNTTGISCTNPTVAAAVASALRTATNYTGSSDGFTWRVGTTCGSGCGGGTVELTATSGLCGCNTGYTIRPEIGNNNWGGITTTSCGAPSQTMTVTFYYTPPPACTTPTAQPTGLSFTPSLFAINGSFTAASPAADNYLVVMTTSSVAPTAPTDGVTYTAGTNALGGKILSAGSTTSFSATGLSDNTPYWFWVYAYNSTSCSGGPTYRTTSPLTSTASTTACALSGTRTVGPTGDYPTIAAAVTAINSVGMGGNLALELQSGYTGESYPITIGQLTCAGASRRLTIRPQTTMTVTASVANTMIDLNGADFVTLDGRVGSTGTTNALTFTNTSTSSAAVALTFTNDATNNIVRYMTLRGASASTIGGVVRFRTTTGTTGNDDNKIEYCDILDAVGFPPPYNCIYAAGTSGKENSNDTIANCNIANFYHTSIQSCGLNIQSGNSDWTISGNRIYQTTSRNYTSSQSIYGININNTSGNNFTIEDNIIGYSSSAGTGTYTMTGSSSEFFYGINYSGGNSGVSNIQGNTITNINFGSTSGTLYGIFLGSGSVNVGTTSPNTIGAATGTGAIVCNLTSNGSVGANGIYVAAASPAVINIQNNIIGGINLVGSSTSVGVGFRGIYCISNAATTVQGNTIGSTTTANSISCSPATTSSGNQYVWGISIDLNNSTPTDPVISGNTVANITANGAGSSAYMYGIHLTNSAKAIVTGNVIRNLSTRSIYSTLSSAIGLAGIAYTGSSAAPVISQNTINTLINANTSSAQLNVAGILITSASNASVSRNRIYDIRNASTYTSTSFPPTAIGIFSYAPGVSIDINNNMIALGESQTTNTAFVGIMQGGTTSGATHRVYYNSVSIGGTASSGGIASSCLLRGNYNGSSYTTTFDIKNNIFTNARTGGTGKHYAIANNINGTSSTSGWSTAASNYNILNSANASTVGYWSADRTIATWRSSSSCDVNSFSGSTVTFTNTSTGDLHINMGTTANDMESHGTVLTGYTTDYDGDARPGPAGSVNGGGFGVDIGADEFDGVPNDNIPPVIVYTNATCGNNGDRVFTANIADPGGVPTTGGNVPRVYFRKGAAAYTSSPGVLTAGTALNGTWSFTVSATTMGGLATGNTVNYYVLAQDNGGSVGSNTNTGLVATNVNTVSTHPSNPSTYSVGLTGTYTVGSGGNYTTISAAASAYNAYCLNGPVTFSLISSTYPSESFPITIGNNASASATNTLTIKPAAGVAATVNGPASTNAIFKLQNARYVTLDGVNSGGSSLTLNSTYTSTFANVWLASTSGTGPGCRNVTIKKLNIVGGSNTTTVSYGILAGMDNGSTPTTSSGMDNDTITIHDNIITKVYYGIYANGTSSTSAGGLNAWNMTGNTFGPSSYSATTNIGLRAMHLVNMVSPVITENVIQNVGITTVSNQAAGIFLSFNVSSPTILKNTITGITSNYSATGTSANVGIYLGSNVLNAQVLKNTISNIANVYPSSGGAASGIILNSGSSASNALIANNFISDIKSYSQASITYAPIGIYLENTNGNVKMYYNTILLNSSFAGYSTSTYSACINIGGTPSSIDLRNNILVNNFNNTNSASDKGWAIYTSASNTAFSEMDYNNYYVSAPNVLAYLSGDRTTLSAIQSFYGRNANCISMSPTFVSTTDLHLQSVVGNSALAAGTPVSVTEDFDEETRSGSTPVMGADETTFAACSSITAGTVSAATPAMCGSGTTTVTATGATTGETMQWRSSTDGSTWTTIAGATNASYVIPSAISVTTQYRFVNKCSSSALADSATVTVTINPIPASITGTLNVCIGTTTTLASATSGGTWSSSNGNVTVGSTTGVVTGVSAGTSVITYTVTATGCYTTAIVTANALPSVSGGSGATICEGNSATLTASGASTYSWSPATGLSATTGASVTASPTATVTYTVTGTNAAGCSANATVTVSVNPIPGTVTASGAGTFCNSTTITASGGTGGTIYFQGTTSGGISTATPSTSEVVTASGTYYFRARTAAGCWGTESSVAVTINPNAGSSTASGGGTFCGSTTITASGGSGGTIYFQGTTSGGTSTATPSSSEVVTASGTYYFRARTGAGCWGPEGSVSVTINPLPAVTASGGTAVCAGGTATLTAGGGITYSWAPAATLSASTGASVAATPTATTTYTVTGTSALSCVNTATVTVTVNPLPESIVDPAASGNITTVAGTGSYGYSGDGGPATAAAIGLSVVAVDPSGNMYLADGNNFRIRKVNSAGVISTIAGTGINGYSGDGGPATAADIGFVSDITVDGAGNILITDLAHKRVRQISPAGIISTIAGNGSTGISGDGGPATTAAIDGISGITVDGAGNIYLALSYSNVIRKINTSGIITTIAGTGTSGFSGDGGPATAATLSNPYKLAVDGAGNLYVSDVYNYRIRKISSSGIITTFAGNGISGSSGNGGPATSARMALPNGIVVDGVGNVFFADDGNHTVRKVNTSGIISVVAGVGTIGYSGDGGPATSAQLHTPIGIAIGPSGDLYVADYYNGRIRKFGTGSVTVCVGTTTTLTNATSGGTWSSSNGNATVGSATGVVTGVAAGTAVITYMLPTSCFTTTVVSVNALSSITASSNVGICPGASTTLTASGGVTYTWSPSAGLSATTGASVTASPTVTTTYTVTGTNAIGCTGTATVTVSMNPLPTAVTVTGGDSYCTSSATLTASGGSGGTIYYQGTTSGGTSTATSSSSESVSSTGTYYFRAQTALGCWGTEGSASVVFNSLPTVASITPSGTNLCDGNSLTLTAGSVTGTGSLVSYNWSGPGSYSSTSSANAVTFAAATTNSGNYSVTVTYPGVGCTSSSVVTSTAVTINANPAAISGADVFCAAATSAYTNATPGGVWSSSNTSVATIGSTSGTATGVAAGTSVLTYTIGGMCFSTKAITVNALPTISSTTDEICVGGTGTVTATPSAGTVTWYSAATGGTLLHTGTTLTVTPTVTTSYYAEAVTSSPSCTSASRSVSTVTVNPVPSVATLAATPNPVCQGSALTLSATGVSGTGTATSYSWTGPASYSSTTTGATQTYTVPSTTASGNYSVTVTFPGSGCVSAPTASSFVNVSPNPVAYNVTGGGTICSGDAGVHIGLDWSITGINYQLYNGSTATGSPVAGSTSALDFGLITTAGTYTVRAANASTGCVNDMIGSVGVTVNPLPATFAVTGGGTACEGTGGVAVGLANSVSGINYQLYNGASAVGSPVAGTGAAISFGNQTVSGTYTVLATNTTTSCSVAMTGSAVVVINPAPTAYALTGGGSYCSGGSGLAIGLANSQSGVSYQLYNGASAVGSAVAGTGSAISFGTYTAAGTYTVLATNTTTTCTGAMTGSTSITINPLPAVYSVTGGGAYCAGGAGITVGLSNSTSGINYQLYNGATAMGSPVAGTNAAISFGSQTLAGTYTVVATNAATGCVSNMTGSAVVVMNPLPVAQTVTGGGSFCAGGAGVAVGLAGSQTNVTYQLYNGPSTISTPIVGTGSAVSFGSQAAAGTYTVVGTNTVTGCVNNMSGSATVVVNPLPAQYVVSGGGNYCAGGSGVEIALNGSNTGMSYQLYNGASVSGSPVAGTNAAISFGTRTATGTYTAIATNTVTGCTSNMLSSAAVIIDPLPAAMAVTGGGSYCAGGAGLAIGLASSASGINYQLYNGASAVGSSVAGTGVAISFGTQTASGTYTVLATNSVTSCTNAMSGSATIIINPLPTVQTVTGGGTYCQYGSGVAVGLASSQSGINYTLYNGATVMGSAVAGTGSAISFGNQTLAGTYTVVGTNATTSCTNAMSGNAVVVMNPAPTAYAVTGGGPYCAGGVGVYVGVANSQTGIVYQLYRGATAVGSPVAGTGSAISFGLQTVAGAYSVLATNTSTSCTNSMSGSATVVVNPLPNAYSTFGGGSYCAGDAGVAVGLSSTQTGVSYQLYNTGTATGAAISGTGYSISFGLQTAAGTYSILATNTSTGCQNVMFGSSVVVVNPLPVVYSVTGGGSYCAGGSGVIVGLSSSESGVNYTTYNGASAYSTVGGVGSAIDFGYVYAAGTYTVLATNYMTGCTSAMSGSATVGVNTPPSAFTVTGGGSYCAGGSGVAVGLASSSSSATYTLYNGTTAVGAPVSGTGSAISFGNQTAAGTYTVRATSTTNGCMTGMTGSATVNVNAAPTAFTVTGGGAYCAGSTGANISLTGSSTGVTYQLYVGTTPVGGPVSGTGGTLSLGTYTTIGTYSAVATVTLTGCTGNMAGSAAITTYTLPTVYNVTGGGSYCSGGLGVTVGLSGSESGITYQLYNGTSPVASVSGTGAAISFGPQFSAGSYSVRATSTSTSCVNGMAGLATVSINPLPSVFVATGGGTLCAGGSGLGITLSGSQTGVNYQLFNGASAVTGGFVPGSGSALSFGTYAAAGVYTVLATNPVTGCSNSMAGTPQIIVNPLPVSYAVTGGGSFCAGGAGVAVGLSGSNTGITYRLYNGSTLVGAAVAGSGGAITFGVQTSAGTYSVRATNNSTGCVAGMTGSANVVVNSLPVAFTVTGGGAYCTGGAGMPVGLAWSESGVNYRLYKDGVAVGGDVAGINGALSFGTFTSAGVYTVAAVSTSSCAQNMSGSATISINPLPSDQSVTGTGGYCAGTSGLNVTLGGSEAGVDYTLYSGGLPTTYTASGTGSAIDFGPVTAGTYSVVAVNSATLCSRTLSGTAVISINALPVTYAVSGGGAYCSGAAGVNISLAGSQSGVSYTLYNGASAVGAPVAGTGSTISFGMQTTVGTYSVMATNTTSGCSSAMSGTASVSVNSAPTVQTVTGGGSYCAGSAGANIGLSSSQSGVVYQLYNGASATGTPVNGTGSAISFGPQTAVGNYSVVAVNSSTGCSRPMSGSVAVSSNPLPVVQTVAGGGAYCSGGAGSEIMLTSSASGISYTLYRGATAASSALAGTGGSLSFGPQTTAGVYTVLATITSTGCTRAMSGTAVVSVNAAPAIQSVTGGGAYCAGGTGSAVGLSGSQIGVNYTISNGTATPVSISGTGGSLTFGGLMSAGTYTVTATDASTSCTSTMAGTAMISVNPLPVEYNVVGGGGYCTGGSGVVIGLDGSQTGVNYQLYNGTASAGLTVSGTGADINFGAQTAAGVYSVLATDATTGCTRAMSVTTSVAVNPAPVVFNMTGGGNYCTGGSGVFVGLDGSEFGVNYRLYKDGVPTATSVAGTGIDITFGMQTSAGMYTVVAENSMTSCTASMSGSAVVGINPAPAAFVVSAGGGYCQGTSGLNISLSGSETGVLYRLYSGSVALPILVAGTGGSIDFGTVTAGTYSVLATSTIGSCTAPMAGTANVVMNTLPAAYSVTGSGDYCDGGSGVAVGLSGSEVNVSYQLYNGASMSGSAVTGTGAAISFGNRIAGNYSVVATNLTTGCVRNMTGNAAVVLNAQPNVYTVTGGGSICSGAAGVNITLSGSQTGVSYRLYRGATQVGSAVAGTGVSLTFAGVNTSGTYTVLATNNTTSCAVGMSGASTVVVNPVPSSFSMTGGGNYCPGTAGVAVGLGGSETGVSYQLYVGSSSVGAPVAGTGSAIDFGTQTMSGSYNVVATNTATSCTANMTGTASVSVNTQPGTYALTAGASAYCAGGAGVAYNLAGSQTGVSYQLFVNGVASGAPVAGTGSPLSFGLRTTVGIYSAVATSVANGCTTVMTGTPSLVVNSLPASFTVTGGGSYCAGSAGSEVALIGSESGITYQAMSGTTPVGAAVAGTGAGVSLGFLPAGTYAVRATNTVTGCRTNMHGTATVTQNAAPLAYTVTGGGQFCSGGTGVAVGLANSAVGTTYRLYKDAVATATTVAGTGSAITFGNQTSAGNYSVVAVNGMTGCTGAMTGSVSISVNPTPAAQTVTGGGALCAGSAGVAVGLDNSATGVNYRLYNGATPVGTAVAGTGGSISFGAQAAAGTYTVLATGTTGGCSRAMTGNAVVVVNPLPASFSVTGGGNYCEGTSGVAIGLSGSAADVSYKLYHGTTVVATVTGTGSSLSFGSITTPGVYSVVASVPATGCARTMLGTASVAMTATVVPTLALNVASGDTICAGTPAVFTSTASNEGLTPAYSWTVNGVSVAATTSGFSYVPTNGDVVSLTLTSSAACAVPSTVSATRTLTVLENQLPSVTATISGDTLCSGNPVTITATAIYGGTAPVFTWIRNGVPAATGNVFTFVPSAGDAIYVRMASNYACRLSSMVSSAVDTMDVILPQSPIVGIVAAQGTTVAAGQALTLSATVTNVYQPTYQWYVNGAVVHGATTSVFTYNKYADNDSVTIKVTNNTPCGPYSSTNGLRVNVSTVGVAAVNVTEFDVRLMPNPTSGSFFIKGSVTGIANGTVSVDVTDMLGQTVYTGSAQVKNGAVDQRVQLDGALANGMYMVTLRTEGTSKVFHLMLQQ